MNTEVCVSNFPIKKTKFILISGKAGFGKTTLSRIFNEISKEKGYTSKIVSFAKNVKFIARGGFGWDLNKDDRGRKLLQNIGRIGRDYNKSLWVESAVEGVEGEPEFPFDFIFVDDWRFPDEVDWIKKNRSLMYDVKTINIAQGPCGMTNKELASDISETALDSRQDLFDIIVYNVESVEKFRNIGRQLLESLIKNEI